MTRPKKTRRLEWRTLNVTPAQLSKIRSLIAKSGLRSEIAIDRMIEAFHRALSPHSSEAGVLAATG